MLGFDVAVRLPQNRMKCYCIFLLLVQSRAFLVSRYPCCRRNRPRIFVMFAEDSHTNRLDAADAIALQRQADALRIEAQSIQKAIEETKAARAQKEIEDVERWIQQLLVNRQVDDSTQILNTEEEVAEILKDRRFSAEQVQKIFDRICETSSKQSIDKCSPLISLLLDAACKVDCLERDENPNKRWNHRVERDLRKKLFAMGWGIDLKEGESLGRFL